jgi:hypothetical protein
MSVSISRLYGMHHEAWFDCTAAVLLAQPHINDTLRDEQGRTPLECSATQEVGAVIEGRSCCLRL